jgi:hypothetical protein
MKKENFIPDLITPGPNMGEDIEKNLPHLNFGGMHL